MAWYKAKWINPFFDALNTIAPNRDKASDGTIGDTAHQASSSGHNPDDTAGSKAERQDADSKPEVRAADAGANLRSNITMQMVVDAILATPADRNRLIYIIFNGYIWSASNGWKRAAYTGSDKHRSHVHLSGHPDSDEDGRLWTSILDLIGGNMALTDAQRDALLERLDGRITTLLYNPRVNDWNIKGEPNQLRLQLDRIEAGNAALRTVVEQLAAVIQAGGGNVETAVILEAMDARLDELAKEQRDAVADLGINEAAVRAGKNA